MPLNVGLLYFYICHDMSRVIQSETQTYHSITCELLICNNSVHVLPTLLLKITYLEVLLDQLYSSIEQYTTVTSLHLVLLQYMMLVLIKSYQNRT